MFPCVLATDDGAKRRLLYLASINNNNNNNKIKRDERRVAGRLPYPLKEPVWASSVIPWRYKRGKRERDPSQSVHVWPLLCAVGWAYGSTIP